jgi:hypothetical protein
LIFFYDCEKKPNRFFDFSPVLGVLAQVLGVLAQVLGGDSNSLMDCFFLTFLDIFLVQF